jgi:hypothetical protein
MKFLLLCVLILGLATSAFGLEKKAYRMREDYGASSAFGLECREAYFWLADLDGDCDHAEGTLSYYYSIPEWYYDPWGPDGWVSYFWGFSGWEQGDMVGCWFQPGDLGTFGFDPLDPENCKHIERIRVLDFAGYGTMYPGLFTVEFSIWPSDSEGCPIGPSIWSSPFETKLGWNCVEIDPSVCIDPWPRVLVTAEHIGTWGGDYPMWALDNISSPIMEGLALQDYGGLPALYPRPYVSHYSTIHSGYYGQSFAYCPPQWFRDCRDSTPDASEYGYIELAWGIVVQCLGPSATEQTTWGGIKSIYK